jgi:hypothetical protein
VYRFFFAFIQRLSTLYPEIFESAGGDQSTFAINHGKKWKGYSSIVELANDDMLKFDEIVKQPLEKCLLYLAYKSDTALVQEMMHKQSMKGLK